MINLYGQIMAPTVLILADQVVETATLLLSASTFTVILAAYVTTSISVISIVFGPVMVVALLEEMRGPQPPGLRKSTSAENRGGKRSL